MLRPYITLTDALRPYRPWPRAGICRAGDSGVAVPGSARLSGAARPPPGPEAGGRRERGARGARVGRRNALGRVVPRGNGAGRRGRARTEPPALSRALSRPAVGLRQRREIGRAHV